MNVTLTLELERLVGEDIKSGRSVDVDDFFNKAVYHYVVARDLGDTYTREELDDMIDRALESIANGKAISGDEAFRRIRAHRAEQRRYDT